jgi:TolB-like protein/DNA-binding winged helix-turn-helix (wHTH) protein
MELRPHLRKRFGAYEFDPKSCELKRNGIRLKITGQPLEVLALLTERPGVLVTREEMHQRLWPADTFVDFDHGLNTCIKRLRQTLGDDPENPRYVETVPRRGYRFIAALEEPAVSGPDVAHPSVSQGSVAPESSKRRRRWYGIALSTLATVLVVVGFLEFRTRHSPHATRVMLAVLPFQNLTGDPQQEYFSDGLTEETITDLGQLFPDKLGVIARTSAMAYKQTGKTIGQIGRELGVDFVLEGSARRDGGKVRVSAQLIRVKDQTHLWAHSYDRELQDVLALQNEIGSAIAEQVRLELTPRQRNELNKAHSVDPDAYEAYLRGRHFWYQFRLDSLNKAIDYYKLALDKDPNYAPAYAGLAAAYSVRANFFTKPADDYPRARAAAQRALELDEGLSTAHEAMAAVHIFYDWDWVSADRELTRSEELNPLSQEYALRAYWFEIRGDTDGAISVLKRGLQLDPFNPLLNVDLGNAYLLWAASG